MMGEGSNTLHFRSNGKLMLSGEYLVLNGAKALALPTKFGQDLNIQPIDQPKIIWYSTQKNLPWFNAEFDLASLEISATNDVPIAHQLQKILKVAQQLNAGFPGTSNGFSVLSNIEFNINWGLGSSSSLISNIAYWAKCDPYKLNRKVFHGSGYDIACARSQTPVIYQLINANPVVEEAVFYPYFSNQLYFIWLNKKQNTYTEIGRFNQLKDYSSEIDIMDEITMGMLESKTLENFQYFMEQHEKLISTIIETPTVKKLFPDFKGSIKSLGAWGGDFILVASELYEADIREYFKQKGFLTVLRFNEMIKNNL